MNKIQDKKLELIMEEILIQEVINNPFKEVTFKDIKGKFSNFLQLKGLKNIFNNFSLSTSILKKPEYKKLFEKLLLKTNEQKIKIVKEYIEVLSNVFSFLSKKNIKINVSDQRLKKSFIKSNNVNSVFNLLNSILAVVKKKTGITIPIFASNEYNYSEKDFNYFFESLNDIILTNLELINENDETENKKSKWNRIKNFFSKFKKNKEETVSEVSSIDPSNWNQIKTTVVHKKNYIFLGIAAILGIIIVGFAFNAGNKKAESMDSQGLSPDNEGNVQSPDIKDLNTNIGGITVNNTDEDDTQNQATDNDTDEDDTQNQATDNDTDEDNVSDSGKTDIQKDKIEKESVLKQKENEKETQEKRKNDTVSEKENLEKKLEAKKGYFNFFNKNEIKELTQKIELLDKQINQIDKKIENNENEIKTLTAEKDQLDDELNTLSQFENLKLDDMQKNIDQMGGSSVIKSLGQLQVDTLEEVNKNFDEIKNILNVYKDKIETSSNYDNLEDYQKNDFLKTQFEKDKTVDKEIKKSYFEKIEKVKKLQNDISAIKKYNPNSFDSKQFSLSEQAKQLDKENSDKYQIDYKIKDGKVSLDIKDLKNLSDNVKDFQKSSDFEKIKNKISDVKEYVKKANDLENKINKADREAKEKLKAELKELNTKMRKNLPELNEILKNKNLLVKDLASSVLLVDSHNNSGVNNILSDTTNLVNKFQGSGEYKWDSNNKTEFFNKIIKGQGISPSQVAAALTQNPSLADDFNGKSPDSSKDGGSIWTKTADGKFKIDDVNAKKFGDAVKKLSPAETKKVEVKKESIPSNIKTADNTNTDLQTKAKSTANLIIKHQGTGDYKWDKTNAKDFFDNVIEKYKLDPAKVSQVLEKNPELKKDFNGESSKDSSIWKSQDGGKTFKINDTNAEDFVKKVKDEISKMDTEKQIEQDVKIISKYNNLGLQNQKMIKSNIDTIKDYQKNIDSGKGFDWMNKTIETNKKLIGDQMKISPTEVDRIINNSKQLIGEGVEDKKDVKDLFTILESNYFKR